MKRNSWTPIVELNDEHFPDWRESDLFALSNAMLGELGEFANALKHSRGGGTKAVAVTQADLVEELVDLWHYMVITLEILGQDEDSWADAVARKVKMNHDRMEGRR